MVRPIKYRDLRLLAVSAAACIWFVLPAQAETPFRMKATTPFVEIKATDDTGHVTYRVGAVFAAEGGSTRRLSFTLICTPKPPGAALSILIVQQGATVPGQTAGTDITIQVDAEGTQNVAAERTVSMPLSAYAVADAGAARQTAQTMRKGKQLRLGLDGNFYDLPLTGFEGELRDLGQHCPGWE